MATLSVCSGTQDARGPAHSLLRMLMLVALPMMVLAGCMTGGPWRDITHPANVAPSPGASPAPGRWDGPWKEDSVGSTLRATFYYGPWQCNQRWMDSCLRECAAQGHVLMGCMWLADIKYDWQAPMMPVKAGSRYALWHCCCDFPELTSSAGPRKKWENAVKSLRRKFAEEFGEWPNTGGVNWPGHHIHDLKHGGNPTDLGNVFPVPPDVHDVFSRQYPACYEGQAPWNTVGPDLPYRD
jgi:hypothetical protein